MSSEDLSKVPPGNEAVLADSVVESGINAIHVLLPQLSDTPASSPTTHLLRSNPNFPFTAYLRNRSQANGPGRVFFNGQEGEWPLSCKG
ncbi:hypothetical protein K443DRAFT_9812 [Laccaria amethystina LaAM-08-1]|uniref:Uncharacterized protein n=1 Tax=Laccaria amethystina LaAM-08-1 TaxID=1095629 RepID=A0A0C9XNG3_9AGAR|nr:hypothetical protein K443DRAFT_9812 [Laccaria amethystina LaAM-08-1]